MNETEALSSHLRTVAVEAALVVAPDLRAAFRSRMDVQFKRDEHDPVTEHDRRAEERIRHALLDKVPDSTVVGEEGGRLEGSGRISWYVDPIDGTANFAHGLAFFCTAIGAVLDGRPVAAAVVDPVAGHIFSADLSGARLGDQPLVSAGTAQESRALLITGFPNSRELASGDPESAARFAGLVSRYGTVRRTGSAALTLAHVAAGWSDAALGTTVNAWDICAAQLLVGQAGGTYVPFGGDPGWDQPCYLAHTRDLLPTALREFTDWYTTRAAGAGR